MALTSINLTVLAYGSRRPKIARISPLRHKDLNRFQIFCPKCTFFNRIKMVGKNDENEKA